MAFYLGFLGLWLLLCLVVKTSALSRQRGERLLQSHKLRCTLLRTPKWMETKGCGYSLRIWTEDISRPVGLLRRENVAMQRVYIQIPDGTLEELRI